MVEIKDCLIFALEIKLVSVSKAERWHISELMRNNRYINSVSQQYGEVELCNTPRTSYTELSHSKRTKTKKSITLITQDGKTLVVLD